jgi:uncharacterized protein
MYWSVDPNGVITVSNMPKDIGVIDLLIGFLGPSLVELEARLNLDARNFDTDNMPTAISYMFQDAHAELPKDVDPVDFTVSEMDRHGIAIGLTGLGTPDAARALKNHPDRFRAVVGIDPNDVTAAVRQIRSAHDEHNVVAVASTPGWCKPQVAIDDRHYYPIYQTCIDLDVPMIINAGVLGPRMPSACQDVMLFDQVCFDFPELRIVMCHGAEPWEALAVKLMLKWPGLHYMTSAFAPSHYPQAIIDYANTRGAQKVMYAGYFPWGLTLERIFSELATLPFRDHVWPYFLRENAVRVFKLTQ